MNKYLPLVSVVALLCSGVALAGSPKGPYAGAGIGFNTSVDNNDLSLKAGMFAQVELQYDAKAAALLVPKRAVLAMDNSSSVFVVNDGKVSRKVVKTGYESDAAIEVLEGLAEGDQVVVYSEKPLTARSRTHVVTRIPGVAP